MYIFSERECMTKVSHNKTTTKTNNNNKKICSCIDRILSTLGVEYYVTDEATTWDGISKDCHLATPKFSVNDAGNFILSGEEVLELRNVSKLVNNSIWIGHYMTFGTFQYIGKTTSTFTFLTYLIYSC